MVDLDPLDARDEELLHRLLVAHRAETDSGVARRLLADWPQSRTRFTKVMPRDYKRILAAAVPAPASGRDLDSHDPHTTVKEVSRG
jgi:glutamate synthase (NADPH/NADH) large chain